ncbi:MAG: hypothetical protein OJF55_000894 [Rhodanobacteraceae bacterium]|nr:MAG: hypothetical protein OJF55_000894 [Rhodanobacteraceae bacterium]
MAAWESLLTPFLRGGTHCAAFAPVGHVSRHSGAARSAEPGIGFSVSRDRFRVPTR